MLMNWLDRDPVLKKRFLECDGVMCQHTGQSVYKKIKNYSQQEILQDFDTLLPAVVAVQLVMFRVLAQRMFAFEAVIGISAGEIGAAYAAGAVSLNEALTIGFAMGHFVNADASKLRMAMVWISTTECEKLLKLYAPDICIATVYNSSTLLISGRKGDMSRFARLLEQLDKKIQLLPVEFGVHSPIIEASRMAFLTGLDNIGGHISNGRLISGTLGSWAGRNTRFDAEFWWNMLIRPVRIREAFDKTKADGFNRYVGISCGSSIDLIVQPQEESCVLFDDLFPSPAEPSAVKN